VSTKTASIKAVFEDDNSIMNIKYFAKTLVASVMFMALVMLTFKAFFYNFIELYDDNESSVDAMLKLEEMNEIKSSVNIDFLACAIYAEAGDEPYIVQMAIGQVLINRINDERFPDTLIDVVFCSGLQKAPYTDYSADPPELSKRAARDALLGFSLCKDALYYCKADEFDYNCGTEIKTELYGYIFY